MLARRQKSGINDDDMAGLTYARLLKPPGQSFFLFGARGVGKSTWATRTFPDAARFDLLDEGLYQSYLADPGRFGRELAALPAGTRVIVDEIQRLPTLLNEVHRAIEDRRLRFVLLGSSARKLKQAGTNLLAGRAVRRLMMPLVPEELGADFDLTKVLRWGSLPVIWQSEDPQDSLQAYVQLYLKEEIQAEALVRNLPGFARFLPVAALFHGQVLNTAGLARDAGVARTTIAGYLDILADTYLAWLLPGFEARLRAKERQHPKFYWVDPGIVRAMRRDRHPPTPTEQGPLFEGWVASLLRTYGDPDHGVGERYDELSYWAPSGPGEVEVDFVLRRGSAYTAIEAKAKRAPSSRDLKGLRAIAALRGLRRRLLVFTGDRPFRTDDGIEGLPVAEFVREVEKGRV
jgi:predicted AAA+ superfamily ATPase